MSGALAVRPEVSGVFFTPPAALEPGRYRAQLQGLADAAGNQAVATAWEFTVYGSGGGVDSDGDGIPDELERLLGYDPFNAHSGGTALSDGEKSFSNDGVPNRVKVVLGWDLASTDSDGNGIPDALEDRDGDRLPDWREVIAGTSLFAHDTDSDTFTDGDEVRLASDPLDPRSAPLRAWISATAVLDRADPAHALRRALLGVAVQNHAPPGYALGEELLDIVVKNAAAPEAVSGKTQAPPTSVRNQSP
jgi:hypothetical protein